MNIHFWGVRGSLPTPVTPQQIQSKIIAAIQRITPEDAVSEEAKAKFISSLPSYIFGTTGGNTACVQLTHKDSIFIIDAGSGLRALGANTKNPKKYSMFISHFHWDHINGFPFFGHAFDPSTVFDIYSNYENAEENFFKQMDVPFSPESVHKSITKNIKFHLCKEGQEFEVDGIKINTIKMNHPGDSYTFSFEVDGKKFVYATDVELTPQDFKSTPAAEKVFRNADAIVLDSQYTVEEAYRKQNWGHSAFCFAVDFVVTWGIKKLFLFHHEPAYDDKKLDSILKAARWYAKYINHSDVEIYIAKEDMEFDV